MFECFEAWVFQDWGFAFFGGGVGHVPSHE